MFVSALENIGILLLMAVPGFLLGKSKLIDREGATKFISAMLLYVTQPFVTINSFLNTPYEARILYNLLFVFFLTALLLVLCVFAGRGVFFFVRDPEKRGMLQYGGAFGNVGFMCVPFLQIFAPNDAEIILYAATGIVSFNLVAWTLGNYLITRDKKYVSVKKALLNPPALSFLLVLPLFVCNLNFLRAEALAPLQNMCRLFANMVGPLAMTLVGLKFSGIAFRSLFTDPKLYLAAAVKLLLAPTLAFCLILILGTFYDASRIALPMIAAAAMPTANNAIMFSTLAGKDADGAARMVLLSTLFAALTIPLALTLFL